VNLDTTKVFIYQLMHNRVALKIILKFTLKRLLHVSVHSPSSGSVLFELAKVIVIKIISQNTSLRLVRWYGCIHTTEPTTTMYFNWLF